MKRQGITNKIFWETTFLLGLPLKKKCGGFGDAGKFLKE
jgi:hypothetical protein